MYKIFLVFVGVLLLNSCKKQEEEKALKSNYPSYFGDPVDLPASPATANQIALGRHLFYETILSKDSTISCGSCHVQKFGFSDSSRFSSGVENTIGTRQSMALSNLMWQKDFFWDGRAASLEEQALDPIENPLEMNLPLDQALTRLKGSVKYPKLFKEAFGSDDITPQRLAIAISNFERSLISSNSKYDRYKQGRTQLSSSESRGEILFFTHPESSQNLRGGNCGDCHSFPHLQGSEFRNNGLDEVIVDEGRKNFTGKEYDKGKFKVPNLRNIESSSPYMHDGRFNTLEQVLDHYNEHIDYHSPNLDPLISTASNNCDGCELGLTKTEKQDIIAFLKTLTDNTFLENQNFSDPNN